MGAAGHPVVAALYDSFMLPQELLGLRRQRARAAGAAAGKVLELGVGTGLNLRHYVAATEVVGIDPDPHMLKRAERRSRDAPCPVRLVEAGAEALPFDDHEFDTVVAALTLCTVPDPVAAVAETFRVLKPEGRFVFFEHVRSEKPRRAAFQDAVTPAWKHVSGGCHWNRATLTTIERHFQIEHLWRRGIFVQGSGRPVDTASGG